MPLKLGLENTFTIFTNVMLHAYKNKNTNNLKRPNIDLNYFVFI